MVTRAGAIGNLPWVRGTSRPGVRMAPRGPQHKEAINAELIAEATKIGGKKFIQKFGLDSWRSIATAVTAGGIIAQGTPEVSKFGTLPGDQPEMEEELKELSEPVGIPIKTWEKSFVDTGTKIPEQKKPEPPDNIPPQIKIETEGLPAPKQKTLEDYILYSKKDDVTKQTKDLVTKKPKFGKLTEAEIQTAKALKEGKPDFYSRAIESIKTAKDDKYTKGAWASILRSSATKNELDYLGLTELLVGNESISKQELLNLVKGKDIAATMTVRSVPKDQMNTMYESYSLGKDYNSAQEGTVEHIVFQIGKDDAEVGKLYKEPHFDTEYGTGTFAHARIQVGYNAAMTESFPNDAHAIDEAIRIARKLKNIQIVDEIQSQHLQTGRIKGFISDFEIIPGENLLEYLKNNNIEYRIHGKGKHTRDIEIQVKPGVWEDEPGFDPFNENMDYIFNKKDKSLRFIYDPEEETKYDTPNEFLQKAYGIVPDFPIKDAKKFVELVLNEMIRKAVIDGRDGIAITNGQIQYNRYDAQTEKNRQGNKKFYDEIVYPQLKKIADKYGIDLERIDIEDPEEAAMDQEDLQLRIPRSVKQALNQNFVLQKLSGEILNELVNNRNLPGHTSIYSNEGRGQGVDYIMNILNNEKQLEANYYIWTKENISEDINNLDLSRDFKNVVWDLPIVPVDDAPTNPAVQDLLNASPEDREHILKQFTIGGELSYPYGGENINNIDLIQYTEYLRNYKPPEGVDLGYPKDTEQLIKMKFPKKLKMDFLSKSIKLTKLDTQKLPIDDQTQRLVA